MSIDEHECKHIIEIAIFASDEPMSLMRLKNLLSEDDSLTKQNIKKIVEEIAADYQDKGVELKEVGSGYRFQIREQYAPYVKQIWQERPPRYSRALLETLVLIAYRQPITRAEIEEVRSVVVSTNIMRTLLEREWVRVVGHRDVPGRPALYATTKQFLDYFNLKSLEEMPILSELKSIEEIGEQVNLSLPDLEQTPKSDNIEIKEAEEVL